MYYDRLHLLHLKQVSCSQRSNVGTTYINGSFNRGAMRLIIFWVCAIAWVSAISLLIDLTYKIENDFLSLLSFISIIAAAVAPPICFHVFFFDNDKYDPYDISDMD